MFCRDGWRTGITKTTKRQLILDCGLEDKLSHAIPAQSSSLTSALSRRLISHDGQYANNLTGHWFSGLEASHHWSADGNWNPVKDSSAIVLGAFPLLRREIPEECLCRRTASFATDCQLPRSRPPRTTGALIQEKHAPGAVYARLSTARTRT